MELYCRYHGRRQCDECDQYDNPLRDALKYQQELARCLHMEQAKVKALLPKLKEVVHFLKAVTSDCKEEFGENKHENCSSYGHGMKCFILSGGLVDDEDVQELVKFIEKES